MITIVQSTTIVAGSGVEATTVQVQGGDPSNENTIVQQGGFSQTNTIDQFGGISQDGDVIQFTGVGQDTHIVTPSQFETTVGAKFVIFPKDFSRGTFLRGVIGTSGTAEQDFDRSPFFFTPSETDPNTLRDFSEAQQFLVFSNANITSFDPYRNTLSSTIIITDRGEEGSSSAKRTEIVTNGSFEQNLSGWTVSGTDVNNTIESRTDAPTGVGWRDVPQPFPTDGDFQASIEGRFPNPRMVLFQEFNFGTRRAASSQLDAFSFDYALSNIVGQQVQVNLIFYLGTDQKFNLRYRVSGVGAPTQPDEVTETPITAITLPAATAEIYNNVARNLREDMDYTSFEFDKIETWFIFDESNNGSGFLLDNVGLTVDIPQPQLLKTSSPAHIDTTHPVSSTQFGLDTLPYTISGSDDISQVDLSGPFFAVLDPASGTRNVPETTDLSFHVQDTSSALDQGTIEVFLNSLHIVTVGTTITGVEFPTAFKTVNASNDIEYLFRSVPGTFVPGDTYTVSGTFADFAAVSNAGEGKYDFTIVGSGSLGATISGAFDVTPPVILPTEPTAGATQVSPNTDILFTLTDDASGVDPSTVKLLLNEATKIENDVATGGTFSRVANISNGFDYTYDSDGQFTFGDTITGTIIAGDFAGNTDSLTYEFVVTPADTLSIENFFLGLNESTVLTTGTTASVCVRDDVYGVASGTTTLTVNGDVPSGLVTTFSGVAASGTAPAKMIFEVPLEPIVDFRTDLVFFVHAENEFPGNFPVIQESQFTLRPGYDVEWPNKTGDEEGGPESTFPYITNIQVLAGITNFAKTFGEASAFFRFLTEGQHTANLGASIVSNIQIADLSAVVESDNPYYEYGKTMVLEIRASDLEGNEFSLTHTYVIENQP